MTHNDTLRSLRYVLKVSDTKMSEILQLGEGHATPLSVIAMLKNEDEPGYVACTDDMMARFLNGLVVFKRGRDETRPPPPVEVPVTNNRVLKRLRVAFELKEDDLAAMLAKSGFTVSKNELSAFFRRPDHRNYRECGDQFLRNVLKALG